jgi:hypothetical protein
MAKRTTRFYRRNEEEVMEALGLQPTKNSGAGWVEKEDGQNDHLIAQLKSTDAASIKVNLRDIEVLEANALVAHKVPVFVIQFLGTGDVFIMARPSDMEHVVEYINTGNCQRPTVGFEITEGKKPKVKTIKSSEGSRNDFWDNKRKEAEQYGETYRSKGHRKV